MEAIFGKFEKREESGRFGSKAPHIDSAIGNNMDYLIKLRDELRECQGREQINTANQNRIIDEMDELLIESNQLLELAKAEIKANCAEIKALKKQIQILEQRSNIPTIQNANNVFYSAK